jgi:DNA primase
MLHGCLSRIVLMLDGDDAGRSASQKTANALTQYAGIRVCRIDPPQGLDPDDLSDTGLTHRLHPFFS